MYDTITENLLEYLLMASLKNYTHKSTRSWVLYVKSVLKNAAKFQ